jgi:two-component system chemotaxis response regulator CheY
MRFNLERAGFHAVVVRNGREAWALLENEGFDLVVTDQQMPGMTGAELCERMRKHERHAQTDVIMLTAKGLELELPRLQKELGVAALFAKPFSPIEVVRAIQNRLAVGAAQG